MRRSLTLLLTQNPKSFIFIAVINCWKYFGVGWEGCWRWPLTKKVNLKPSFKKKIWGRCKILLLITFLGLLKIIVHLFSFSNKLFKYFDLTGACVSRWCWLQWLTPMLTEEYSLLSPHSGHQASEVRKVWLESPHQQSQSIRNNFKFLHPSSFSASPREFPTSSSHFRHRLKWVICVILRWRDDAFYI